MSQDSKKNEAHQLVREQDLAKIFHELNSDDEKGLILQAINIKNLGIYHQKKVRAIAYAKNIVRVPLNKLFKILSISGYLTQSMKNNIQISKGIKITTKNMIDENFSVLMNQVEEERIYEKYIFEYSKNINIQMQFQDSFITCQTEDDQIKEKLNQSKQRMKSLSKAYVKK